MNNTIMDKSQREEALNPAESFIVQAPAGSGKTEILTQRYLRLLATVKDPEQIIAITFTRKAATEMRERILSSLMMGQNEQPELTHKRITWELAKQALANNKKYHWHLLENPNRLRILTIDALAAFLTGQMPLLASFGAKPAITPDASTLYTTAIERTFMRIFNDEHWADDLKTILLHLDNRLEHLQRLLYQLLSKREQWLPIIVQLRQDPDQFRPLLEESLTRIGEQAIEALHTILNPVISNRLTEYLIFAGKNLNIATLANLTNLSNIHSIKDWQQIINLLLTKEQQWRKQITKNEGFPAHTDTTDVAEKAYRKQMKAGMKQLLTELSEQEGVLSACQNIMLTPPGQYTNSQWHVLRALIQLLPLVIAELQLIFRERGEVDFIELNLAALRALGTEDNITDLALYLDYKIQHLLVDEFQDTSTLQFHLLEKIINEWQPNDGRTLFLVGDPMQSIYRFRNAEVSLFLRVCEQGIAQIKPKPLQLQQNFRTQANLVEWFNDTFITIFPQQSDITIGAVTYSQATAYQPPINIGFHHYEVETSHEAEANKVANIIQTLRLNDPHCTIAILVKSRSHLGCIVPTLQTLNIPYQAVDIDSLAELSCVQDLFALTRAYLHCHDSVAWYAVLRAPWAGLSLTDLHVISEQSPHHSIWPTLLNHEKLNLSSFAKKRLSIIVPLLQQALQNKGRLTLTESIKGLWLALGGPATLPEASALIATEKYFDCLSELANEAKPITAELIGKQLPKLFATLPSSESNPVEIMTIHKSKGLEFDHIIIPSLERGTNTDRAQLFSWYEKPHVNYESDLVLAPIKASTDLKEPINDYIKSIENQRSQLETARVFYVACTRAKQQLHLIAKVNPENRQEFKPSKTSFLAMLWLNGWQPQCPSSVIIQTDSINPLPHQLSRHPQDWQYPTIHYTVTYSTTPIPIQLEQDANRIIGIVIHQLLENMTLDRISKKLTQSDILYFKSLLNYHGLLPQQMEDGINKIQNLFAQLKQSELAPWIFASRQTTQTEYRLTSINKQKIQHHSIDRTFIDQNNIRWIIDFKTSEPNINQPIDQFIASEIALYQSQLEGYAELFSNETRPIKLVIYWTQLNIMQELDNAQCLTTM